MDSGPRSIVGRGKGVGCETPPPTYDEALVISQESNTPVPLYIALPNSNDNINGGSAQSSSTSSSTSSSSAASSVSTNDNSTGSSGRGQLSPFESGQIEFQVAEPTLIPAQQPPLQPVSLDLVTLMAVNDNDGDDSLLTDADNRGPISLPLSAERQLNSQNGVQNA